MNIPKSAIEKAIEGGWHFKDEVPDEVKQFGEVEIAYAMWESVALDPTFWVALGKALGWDVSMMYFRCPADECESTTEWSAKRFCPECGTRLEEWPTVTKNWEKYAKKFYDLILAGKSTTDFWQELLANPSEE